MPRTDAWKEVKKARADKPSASSKPLYLMTALENGFTFEVELMSPIDEAALIRKGIDPSYVETLSNEISMPAYKLAETLGISTRTLIRRKRNGAMLDSDQSEKLIRVQRVMQAAVDVVGRHDREKAVEWLNRKERALGDATPLSMLDTSAGERAVMNLLGAIREGVVL